MQLTIAQFTFGMNLAGQERVVVDLAKAFRNKGHNSLVCTILFGGELVNELESAQISYHCLGFKKSFYLRVLAKAMHYLKENKVNVVITHGTYSNLMTRIAAIILKIPVIIHVEHNISDQKKFYHIIFNKILSIYTDKIVCVSEKARQSLLEIEHVKSEKVQVIRNGIDVNRFLSSHPRRNRNDKKKRIGIVSRFSIQKGHIYFVEAAEQIVKLFKDVEFIYLGDGPLRQTIEQKVREYSLDKYSHFLGVRSDVSSLMQSFDVIVLPSLWEGLPISLIEAQYFGVVSIVTDVGGNAEIVEDGYNGFVVPSKDPSALAMAILKTLQDDELRYSLGINSKKVFAKQFSINKSSTEYILLINSILNRKNIHM